MLEWIGMALRGVGPSFVLAVLLSACATTSHGARHDGLCARVEVEVDRQLPTRHGLFETRAPARLWIDTGGTPHVAWASRWWRSTRARTHDEMLHATWSGLRWRVEDDPWPPGFQARPGELAHDGSRWYVVQRADDGSTRLWVGVPWRTILEIGADQAVLLPLFDRAGDLHIAAVDTAGEPRLSYWRFRAGQLVQEARVELPSEAAGPYSLVSIDGEAGLAYFERAAEVELPGARELALHRSREDGERPRRDLHLLRKLGRDASHDDPPRDETIPTTRVSTPVERLPGVIDDTYTAETPTGWARVGLAWPDGIARDSRYDRIASASGIGRDVAVGVAWRPRGPARRGRSPHGDPYTYYGDDRVGRGALVVWTIEGTIASAPTVAPVRLRRNQRPQVEIGPDGAIHILLQDGYASGFAPDRYVRLRCAE